MGDEIARWWQHRSKLGLAVFLGIGGYFLWTEHRAHVIEYLPWIFLLGCAAMHLFMHGGHSHHRGERRTGLKDGGPKR